MSKNEFLNSGHKKNFNVWAKFAEIAVPLPYQYNLIGYLPRKFLIEKTGI